MKQIDITRMYSQKRCLIVDKSPEERTTLKKLLIELGVEKIHTAGSAEEAIELCEQKQYDLLISEYELGASKNGQQLIEELRFHRLLKLTAIYILVTDNTSSQHVLHAIEYQPDDYLSKPISKQSMRDRLNASIVKKEALFDIYDALEHANNKLAIDQCKKCISTNSSYKIDVLKVLSELYIQTGAIAQAHQIYKNILQAKSLTWARLGLARTYYKTKQLEKAEQVAIELTTQTPLCVDGHELLAKILRDKKQFIQAQHAMSKAVELTPKSVVRQRLMGELSIAAENDNAARHAYKAAVKHGKNSCHENFEDYVNLASSCVRLSKKMSDKTKAKQLTDEALQVSCEMSRKYNRNPQALMRHALLEAAKFELTDKIDAAEEKINEAVAYLDQITDNVLSNSTIDFNINCAQILIAKGRYSEGEALLRKIAALNDDPDYSIKIDKLLREPLSVEGIAYAASLNEQGIKLYEQKQFHEAANYFRKVILELPNHIAINLNLVQALTSKAKTKALSREEVILISSCLKKVKGMDIDHQHKTRLDYLIKKHTHIVQSQTEPHV